MFHFPVSVLSLPVADCSLSASVSMRMFSQRCLRLLFSGIKRRNNLDFCKWTYNNIDVISPVNCRMCFICFRGYSNTNVLLHLKKVHDLNTNRKYSMILLLCCWEMLGFLAYPGFSCPSLASLSSIFFFSLYCFLQSLALSFQSIDSLGSPDTEVSFVLLSTCLNGNQRPQLPSSAVFCSVEDCGWHRCRFHLVMLAAFTPPLGLL